MSRFLQILISLSFLLAPLATHGKAIKTTSISSSLNTDTAIVNIIYKNGSNEVDFSDSSITENTRVSYPLSFIKNTAKGNKGENIKNNNN